MSASMELIPYPGGCEAGDAPRNSRERATRAPSSSKGPRVPGWNNHLKGPGVTLGAPRHKFAGAKHEPVLKGSNRTAQTQK